jgi:hypothetical protein
MTMHLAQGVNSLRTNRKLKPKYTNANVAKWTEQCRLHNKEMKRMGQPTLSFDEFVDYIHGRPPKQSISRAPTSLKQQQSYRRETVNYPSRDSGVGVAPKIENPRYTGTLVKGIATMHKSNAVPIIDDQQAKDISSMRR